MPFAFSSEISCSSLPHSALQEQKGFTLLFDSFFICSLGLVNYLGAVLGPNHSFLQVTKTTTDITD